MSRRHDKAGIYMITSNIDESKFYIGSSCELNSRFRSHKWSLLKNRHGNRKMQNYFNCHGIDSFSYSVVEFCDIESLIEREQYYIDTMSPYFNICPTAYSSLGLKWKNESKILSSIVKKLIACHPQYVHSTTGMIHSQEARKKIGMAEIGNTKNKGKRCPHHCKLVMDMSTGVCFIGAREAAEAYGFETKALMSRLNGKQMNKTNLKYI